MGPGGRAAPPGRVKAKAYLDPAPGRAHARGVRDAAAPAGGGARRRGEAGPERGRGGAHGDEEVAANLTGDGAGEERQRRGGATSRGGGGRRRSPTALQGGRGGRVRGEIERGKGGDAPRARN